MQTLQTNHFWYKNCSDNVCTFIHRTGKKEGYMCHRKIRTNLVNGKKDNLCCIHSKKHIPKKRYNTGKKINEYINHKKL